MPEYRVDDDGNLWQVPDERVEHTPVTSLWSGRRLVGLRCQHCGLILTPNGTPSQEKIPRMPKHDKPGVVRVVDNKAHALRAEAAAEGVWDRFKNFLKGVRSGE